MSRLTRFLSSGAVIALLALPLAACDNGPSTTDTTTPTTPTTSPVTETYTSQLFVGGSTSHGFTAAKAGTATVTLVSAGPPSTIKVGFGVGVPDVYGSGCLFTRSADSTAGASFSLPVDAGTYCVRVYDIGNLTENISFSLTIVRP